MGNIFSNEEKLLQDQKNKVILERNPKRIYRIYEQYGNHQANHLYVRQNRHQYQKRRNISFHGSYSKNEYLKTKSQSLNAILEELYTFGPEDYVEDGETKIRFETGGSLIPRIKLKRSTSSLKEEKSYEALCKMSSESEIILGVDSTISSINSLGKKENHDISRSENSITILLNDQAYNEISSKSDENYFTKNFDDCMKRLQQIEKEHELIENEDIDVEYSVLQKENKNIQKDVSEQSFNYKSEYEFNDCENRSVERKSLNLEIQSQTRGNNENLEAPLKQNSMPTETVTTVEIVQNCTENKKPMLTSWYSNLKQQFEKTETEEQEAKTKEMSCRITGATLKNTPIGSIKSKENEKDTKHYFSRLVKTNKSLIDEELPDPDKVKHIRAMFQETLNSTLKKKLDKKLGGSLQNISFRSAEQQMNRPLSAQCYRNDIFCEGRNNPKLKNEKDKTMKENLKSLEGEIGEFQIEKAKKKLFEKHEKELKPGRDGRSKRILQSKWTDTGSVSSGISSDLSSYDTDLESYSREGTEQDEMIVSDDDLLDEMKDKHYVQNEVLEKIRSFGTSVTYYGGEMITCSVGPLLSPTTQAIMEEISEKYGSESSPIRSFDEFYRKYLEANEHNRMKKIGRTRSFGQNDVFQKPNILNNTEIELYKNDLEIEIGIKKPLGIPPNSFKRKVTKTASLDTTPETIEKTTEKYPGVIICTSESNVHNNPAEEKETSEKDLVMEYDKINKDVTEETLVAANFKAETKLQSETETKINTSKQKEIENETDIMEEESGKPDFEKDRFFFRSKSAPEGFSCSTNTSNQCKIVSNNTESPATEIFYSYEKSLFNQKRHSDMEFEEFEVCESLTEKLEKLEKINSLQKTTISQENLELSSFSEEKSSLRTLSELKPNGESQICFENNSDEEIKLSPNTSKGENVETKKIKDVKESEQQVKTVVKSEDNESEKKELKNNCTKWPIKTSVMVDIQKNSEQTPKLISSGKTIAKTKIRLF